MLSQGRREPVSALSPRALPLVPVGGGGDGGHAAKGWGARSVVVFPLSDLHTNYLPLEKIIFSLLL